jgi:hypothetical protein
LIANCGAIAVGSLFENRSLFTNLLRDDGLSCCVDLAGAHGFDSNAIAEECRTRKRNTAKTSDQSSVSPEIPKALGLVKWKRVVGCIAEFK